MTEQQVPGFFWSDRPHTVRIPVVLGGRHAPTPWVRDQLCTSDWSTNKRRIDRHQKNAAAEAKRIRRARPSQKRKPRPKREPVGFEPLFQFRGEQAVIREWERKNGPLPPPPEQDLHYWVKETPKRKIRVASGVKHVPAGWEFKSYTMKPNPKFELVVVNKHDRAALLKLLSEVDTETSVARWLYHRTERNGATLSSALFTDYGEWCSANDEVALGRKAFAQALVANGVVKLTRSREGERYELELRPAPRSAGTSRG